MSFVETAADVGERAVISRDLSSHKFCLMMWKLLSNKFGCKRKARPLV